MRDRTSLTRAMGHAHLVQAGDQRLLGLGCRVGRGERGLLACESLGDQCARPGFRGSFRRQCGCQFRLSRRVCQCRVRGLALGFFALARGTRQRRRDSRFAQTRSRLVLDFLQLPLLHCHGMPRRGRRQRCRRLALLGESKRGRVGGDPLLVRAVSLARGLGQSIGEFASTIGRFGLATRRLRGRRLGRGARALGFGPEFIVTGPPQMLAPGLLGRRLGKGFGGAALLRRYLRHLLRRDASGERKRHLLLGRCACARAADQRCQRCCAQARGIDSGRVACLALPGLFRQRGLLIAALDMGLIGQSGQTQALRLRGAGGTG